MNKIGLGLLIILVLGLALVGGISAQEGDTCFNLAAEDCAVVTAAETQMDAVTAFTYTLNLNLTLEGLGALIGPDAPATMEFGFQGEGAIDMTASAFDITYNITMADEAPLNGNITVADAAIYLTGADGATQGATIADITTSLEAMGLGEMLAGYLGEGDTGELALPDTNPLALLGIGDLDITPYANYERLADEDLNGVTVSPFQLTVNLTGLLNDPAIAQMMTGLSAQDPTGGMLGMLLPLLQMAESEVGMVEYVGADGYIYQTTFNLSLVLPPETGMPINVALLVELGSNDFDAIESIKAPEGATMLTAEEVQAMLQGYLAPVLGMLGGAQ